MKVLVIDVDEHDRVKLSRRRALEELGEEDPMAAAVEAEGGGEDRDRGGDRERGGDRDDDRPRRRRGGRGGRGGGRRDGGGGGGRNRD